jgi:hypothetical protein
MVVDRSACRGRSDVPWQQGPLDGQARDPAAAQDLLAGLLPARERVLGQKHLRSFAHGLKRGYDAVLAELTLPYGCGAVEGNVNRTRCSNGKCTDAPDSACSDTSPPGLTPGPETITKCGSGADSVIVTEGEGCEDADASSIARFLGSGW